MLVYEKMTILYLSGALKKAVIFLCARANYAWNYAA